MKLRELFKIIGLPVIAASLCCLSPVIIVLFGLGTATFAGSLADTLYGEYKWLFRSAGTLLLALSLILHFRKQGVCTLDGVRRRKNEILNAVILTVLSGIAGYFFFLYVVVEYIGIALNIWE